MFVHNLNPILLKIGFVEIRWYGLMYLLAFIIAYFFVLKQSKHFGLKLTKDKVVDWLFYCALGMLVFARLFEVVYYNPTYYFANLWKIFAIWEGGLSFHGGLLGFVIGTYVFGKKEKISFLKLADLMSIPAALGLMLGRIGNFINGELVGRISSVPWCVQFKGHEGCRHPSQLYESFKNLIIFVTLFNFRDKKKPEGFIFFLLMIMYAVLRSVIEQYFREPVAYHLGLTEGQFLNVFLFLIGIVGMYYIYRKN